jgi:16S rRNA (adenine1518-N6/adenine1519-N6)-dimethyltransferase
MSMSGNRPGGGQPQPGPEADTGLPPSQQPALRPLDVPGLLKAHGLRPDHKLGQNFLFDDRILSRLVEAAEITPQDTVLEVGAGLGSLTRHLASSARQVVAVELDKRLVEILKDGVKPYPNVTVVQGDILALDPSTLMAEPDYRVVANIPYYITSALLRHLLEAGQKPDRLVLTVQREVAERISAGPGEMSLLALSVQVYGKPQTVLRIPAGAFYPPPKVDSAVVRIDLYPDPAIPQPALEAFFRLIKAGFSQKRKTLRNSLSAGLRIPPDQAGSLLESSQIDPQRRAETLSLEEWGRLTGRYQDPDRP